jgi:site-specific recombinase XerD
MEELASEFPSVPRWFPIPSIRLAGIRRQSVHVVMLLLDALESFLRQCDANGRSPHTTQQYQRHVALLSSWAQQQGLAATLEALDHEALARFLASPCVKRNARGTPRKPTSANTLRSTLRTFFAYARAAGFLDKDPARLVRRARTGTVPPRGLTVEQRDRLLAALATGSGDEARRDRVLFTLMLGCGIRIGSALALDVEDLDLAGGRVRLRQVKNGGEQEAFLPVPLREELAASRSAPPARSSPAVSPDHHAPGVQAQPMAHQG